MLNEADKKKIKPGYTLRKQHRETNSNLNYIFVQYVFIYQYYNNFSEIIRTYKDAHSERMSRESID